MIFLSFWAGMSDTIIQCMKASEQIYLIINRLQFLLEFFAGIEFYKGEDRKKKAGEYLLQP
jgi:hypothetical protein